MNTTATNRKIRVLLTAIRSEALVPRPEFQRRLVWSNKHKNAFIYTVLRGYPFPEIYIAAGKVDPDSGEGTELLVDGQQRMTTLFQYFTGSEDLKLNPDIRAYSILSKEEKEAFLEYEVVIRDLGKKNIEEIKEIFRIINSTNYVLNSIEIHNAKYDGEFIKFAESIAENVFFETHNVFKGNEIRRMSDIKFALAFIVTVLSAYFHRELEIEPFLIKYNDEFPEKEQVEKTVFNTFKFIDSCNISFTRAWNKADLLNLLVEVYKALVSNQINMSDASEVGARLNNFYGRVEKVAVGDEKEQSIILYYYSASQASNDRSNRISRGKSIQDIILNKQLSWLSLGE
ncbi:MAG: DUF262 domain-containing protein [Ignavibacteriota bacterium]